MTIAKHPTFLDKYELRELLGQGGYAKVWKAYDPQLERYVAIKLMHDVLLQRPDFSDFSERFLREARVMASLRHPNIVQIHDMDHSPSSESSSIYLIMQYVEGQTLESYLAQTSRKGIFPPARDIVHLFTALCSAIDYAHRQGVIHRDIKPANILLDRHRSSPLLPMGEPMLTDFGLVKIAGLTTVTEDAGKTMGTPLYLAPEQAQGLPATRQSDLYALGIILFELCTGSYPYQQPDQSSGQHVVAILQRHITSSPMPPRLLNPALLPAVAAVLLRAIAKDPAHRYPDATALAQALAEAFEVTLSPHGDLPAGNLPAAVPSASPAAQAVPAPGSVPVERAVPQGSHMNVPDPPGEEKQGVPERKYRQYQRWQKQLQYRVRFLPIITRLVLLAAVVFALILWVSLGLRAGTHNAPPSEAVVGTVAFASSGQGALTAGQGIDDIVHINLQHLASPAPGKSYYAWLRSDSNQSDTQDLLLGRLDVQHGVAQLTYPGDQAHTNLLAKYSRFLVTDEDATNPPSVPSLDTRTWRYMGEIPQIPDPNDKDHFSMLDHLRHLVASDPRLAQIGLPGGLSTWLLYNTAEVQRFTSDVFATWQAHNVIHLRRQLIRILDYLDGRNAVVADVPPNTPFLANPVFARIGLLQNSMQPSDPPGYLVHIGIHLTGLVNSPGATEAVREQAEQINNAINRVQSWLERVRQDAKTLLSMTDQQLLQPAVLPLVSDVVSSTNAAYGSQGNGPQVQQLSGVLWIHAQLQALAVIVVSFVHSFRMSGQT